MPTNVTAEYRGAEQAYRQARTPQERLDGLHEMLRTLPKHKGTEHLQADIKTRIKQLTDDVTTRKKTGGRGPLQVVRPEGAAQIALLGAPNVGKSSLHAALTSSHAQIGPYPYTTQALLPGMLPFEDILFQLVDLPPISRVNPVPWIVNAVQPADGCMLVIDLQAPDCVDQVIELREILEAKRISLIADWGSDPASSEADVDDDIDDPFAIRLPTLLVVGKADLNTALAEEVAAFHELLATRFPHICVSTETGDGLADIGSWLFEHLGIVRVYTKPLGRAADMGRPFTVRNGGTVDDVARLVHKDFTESLKYARLWRDGVAPGLQVGHDHPVRDKDVLELHV